MACATLKELDTGEVHELGAVTRIGRAKDNDVVLGTGSVSKGTAAWSAQP